MLDFPTTAQKNGDKLNQEFLTEKLMREQQNMR